MRVWHAHERERFVKRKKATNAFSRFFVSWTRLYFPNPNTVCPYKTDAFSVQSQSWKKRTRNGRGRLRRHLVRVDRNRVRKKEAMTCCHSAAHGLRCARQWRRLRMWDWWAWIRTVAEVQTRHRDVFGVPLFHENASLVG